MMYSMTGYGKAEIIFSSGKVIIEIKSLNSKQIDINLKIPSNYREKEVELRKLITKKLNRGKIDLFLWQEKSLSSSRYSLNVKALKSYYNQISNLKKELDIKWNMWTMHPFKANSTDIIPTLLNMPEALQKEEIEVNKNEWDKIKKGIDDAINNIIKFRLVEGEKLSEDIFLRIDLLKKLLKDIYPLAQIRIEKIKDNLNKKLKDIDNKNIDQNRFEQELIFYLEKQDITEEQVRLESHLNYFKDIAKKESPNGKKLGFIVQEISREINTIGSKSFNAEMQKIVVEMKDELEKIKEQLLNIL